MESPLSFFRMHWDHEPPLTRPPATLSPSEGEREGVRGRFMESAGVTAARRHRVNGPFHIVVHGFERRARPPRQILEIYRTINTRAVVEKTNGFPARRRCASQILEWVRKSALKRAEARAPERVVYAASPGFALVSPVSNGRFDRLSKRFTCHQKAALSSE